VRVSTIAVCSVPYFPDLDQLVPWRAITFSTYGPEPRRPPALSGDSSRPLLLCVLVDLASGYYLWVLENGYVYRTLMYRMDISRFVEWIKLSPRHLLPLSSLTGFLLFAPQRWLAVFAPLDLTSSKRG
jgi:hypothetical protein